MSIPTSARQWTLREKPHADPVLEGANPTFTQGTASIPELQDGQVLLKTLYLSNDPAQRTWISRAVQPGRLYVPPVETGEVMRAGGIGQVVNSRHSTLKPGDLVTTTIGWTDYSVHDGDSVSVIDPPAGLAVTHFLGALGLAGFTAWYGLYEVAKVTSKDAIVISGAAGAVGNVAVQIAKKLIGCRKDFKKVIGIAGTDDKCRGVEVLGADVCLNYKSPSFKEDLTKATDGFVEVYFDNVGGEILDFMLTRLARHGRVAACGAISNYNRDSDPTALKNYFEVVSMRLQILGFIVIDGLHLLSGARAALVEAWQNGKLLLGEQAETVVDTNFSDIPRTWSMLYSGGNTGKLITKLKD
ncbi:hypothetical protein N7468_004608 [Penicillium chermesinum]|uniref:Enoyl reductase (ER) domain-containing protein n=1 Tax=Penicillium chermesinum TaxID=63820 RepID=A0A9W9P8M8_9EURO|nr:uncharacterized protein N7468_004608 [Penicillium chermesinum]KAJ5239989.1 hypothetical protein N7468_004608 [Penicillium chermesinum]KAJ6166864.1 hypothetical protein N7470_002311 [Penicillium chermesinum]